VLDRAGKEGLAKPSPAGRFRFQGALKHRRQPPSKIGANKCDPVLYGNYLLIHGEGEDRSYFYAHMPRPALVHEGERVWTGERVGAVGETGNAITIGCHLHFEIHVLDRPVDPEPSLRRWDRYS